MTLHYEHDDQRVFIQYNLIGLTVDLSCFAGLLSANVVSTFIQGWALSPNLWFLEITENSEIFNLH